MSIGSSVGFRGSAGPPATLPAVPSRWSPWLQAFRPLAHANLAPPLLYGQALAYGATGRFDPLALTAVALWGMLDQGVIVFANDYADRDHDRAGARTAFSGGSGVLVEGKLSATALRGAARASFALLGVLSAWMAWAYHPVLLALWLAAGLTLWLYSFGPRLSYRGGGEWLQALGVRVILPLVGFAAQARTLDVLPLAALAPSLLLGLAGNVATALPDIRVDTIAAKRTWPVRAGAERAARGCVLVSAVAISAGATLAPGLPALYPALLPLAGALALSSDLGRDEARARRRTLGFVLLQGAATQLYYLVAAGALWTA